jgi:predicted amidophosphoribosyltransferase
VSFGAYEGALRKLIYLLKYEQLRAAATVLAAPIATVIAERLVSSTEPVLLIVLRLHRIKRRQRGFNQSEPIARSVLRYLDRARFEVHIGNLRRVRATVSPSGLTRHQRRENVRGAFVVANSEAVWDRKVVPIDDVYTTGATLNQCARVPRKPGAREGMVATAAKVYRELIGLEIVRSKVHGGPWQTQQEHAAIRAIAG